MGISTASIMRLFTIDTVLKIFSHKCSSPKKEHRIKKQRWRQRVLTLKLAFRKRGRTETTH